jgi:sigma-B regulation protein RsbU (phosphoserine phosphatase)
LDLIGSIRAVDADLPVLAMTAWGSIDLAVEAMRLGASDFVQKPWATAQLLQKVKTLADRRALLRQSRMEEQEERGDAVAIQRKLLAFEAPGVREGEISGMSHSLRFVGGDYCKVDEVGARRFAVSIADVAGKGVPGAMLAASLRAAERPLIAEGLEPKRLCAALNRAMTEITPPGKFISFFFGLLDLERKALVYSNAGHNPPLLVRNDGTVQALGTGGAVLGYFTEWDYEQASVELASGDRIVLFTDGIVEAWDEDRGEFGVERLAQLAGECRGLDAGEMQRRLTQAVSEHCGGSFQDDATLVVIVVP